MTEPLCLHETVVRPEWIDEYGHLNMANYVRVCDDGTYAFWNHVNDGRGLEERDGAEYAVVETHVNYLDEVRLDDPLRVTTQLLAADEKRFRLFHVLYHATKDYVAATNEVMALGFNLKTRALMRFHDPVRARLQEVLAEHASLPMPQNAGRAIGMPRRRT